MQLQKQNKRYDYLRRIKDILLILAGIFSAAFGVKGFYYQVSLLMAG